MPKMRNTNLCLQTCKTMSNHQPVKVKCYSGQTYAERPDSFIWEGTEHKIERVEKEWLEPGEKHFTVRTEDERLFQLCYHEQEDKWSAIEIIKGV